MKFSNNNLSFSLARAIFRSPVMARVAVFSVAVSMMVMNIAVCVVQGFSIEVDGKVKGILSSYTVVKYDNNFSTDRGFVRRDSSLERRMAEGGFSVSAYATKAGLARSGEQISGVEMKGLNDPKRLMFYQKYLVSGRLPKIDGAKRSKEIILSKSLAEHLGVKNEDVLQIVFFEEPPLRERYKVVGIYDTAIGTLDKALIITSLQDIQYIYEWERDCVSGYEVTGGDGYDALCDLIDAENGESLLVNNISESYPQIYSWLELQKSNELVILSIMLIVGVINIISMILIMLLQNIYQIGVFTILGMKQRNIRTVFIIRSLGVVLKAIAAGNAVSLILLYLQQQFKIIKLDAVGYSVDSVPVDFAWMKMIAINVFVILVMLLFQWLTTFVISKVEPSTILKYEKR